MSKMGFKGWRLDLRFPPSLMECGVLLNKTAGCYPSFSLPVRESIKNKIFDASVNTL